MKKNADLYSLFCFVGLDNIVNNIYIGIADYIVHKIESYDRNIIANDVSRAVVICNKIVNELANIYPVDRGLLNTCTKRSVSCRNSILSLNDFLKRLPSSVTYEEITGIDTNLYAIDQSYFDYYKNAYSIMSLDDEINSIIDNCVNNR